MFSCVRYAQIMVIGNDFLMSIEAFIREMVGHNNNCITTKVK